MTDTETVRCHLCGKVWATVRTYDGTVWAVERHDPDCSARPIRATLLPEPGPQGDAV